MNLEVFKQAQSRGWMEGWRYFIVDGFSENPFYKQQYNFFNDAGQIYKITLNDILFDPVIGIDFWKKFIGDYCTKKDCIGFDRGWLWHMAEVTNYSEQERIEFLEKHLEVKEEGRCRQCMLENNTGICNRYTCSNHKKTEPVEVKEIGKMYPLYELTTKTDLQVQAKYTNDKINELVDAFNAHVKDCKLTRN